MFSEENIERTKERLVEYVKDNRYPFARKYDDGRGGYWEITAEGLSAKPIEDAIEVFGETGTVDIITETLNEIYGVSGVAWHQFELKEPVGLSIAQLDSKGAFNKPFSDESNLKDLLDDDEDEDYYDDYDEDDYGYDEDYGDYFDDDDDDIPLNQSTNKPKDKNELLSKLKEFDDQISILQSMGFLSHAWRDDRDESEDSSEGLILSDVLNLDDVSFKDMDEFKKIIEANVEFENEDEEVSDKEMVNHPPHYNQGKFETIDIIEDIVMGYDDPVVAYLVGTTLKYLARAPFKNAEKQDLEKAEFYLKRAIEKLTKQQ